MMKLLPVRYPFVPAKPSDLGSIPTIPDHRRRPSPAPIRLWTHRCPPHCRPKGPRDHVWVNSEESRAVFQAVAPDWIESEPAQFQMPPPDRSPTPANLRPAISKAPKEGAPQNTRGQA